MIWSWPKAQITQNTRHISMQYLHRHIFVFYNNNTFSNKTVTVNHPFLLYSRLHVLSYALNHRKKCFPCRAHYLSQNIIIPFMRDWMEDSHRREKLSKHRMFWQRKTPNKWYNNNMLKMTGKSRGSLTAASSIKTRSIPITSPGFLWLMQTWLTNKQKNTNLIRN